MGDEHQASPAVSEGPPWIRPVPNVISAARVLLALYFPFAPPAWWLALAVTAGVSDAVDGFIARRYHATSAIGGLLDAGADKLFTTIALLTLASAGMLAPWHVPLLMTRDIFVVGTAAWVALRRRWDDLKRMQSRRAGKATTLAIFALMGVTLWPLPGAVFPLTSLSMACSFAAAVDYAQSYARGKNGRPPESGPA